MSKDKNSDVSYTRYLPVIGKMSKFTKLLKTVKFLKPIMTMGSLGFTVLAYSFRMGFWFSLCFVLMILIHELGHVFALKRKGLKASAPIFIPFFGAAIFAPDFGDRDDEAYMGYAGPLIGGAAAAILLVATALQNNPSELLRVLAFTSLLINAFNLIPIRPFDGGRITQAVGSFFVWVGLALLFSATLILHDPGLLLIWIFILSELPLKNEMRVKCAIGIYALMAICEILGLGRDFDTVTIVIDLVIGLVFIAIYAVFDGPEASSDNRPRLPKKRRIFWLAMYVCITAALVGLTIASSHYLPPSAR